MIGRGDGHRVDVFIFEQFAQVLVHVRLLALQLLHHLRGALGLRLVHVADGHHARIRQLAVILQVIAPAPAQADHADADFVVGRRPRAHRNQTGAQ